MQSTKWLRRSLVAVAVMGGGAVASGAPIPPSGTYDLAGSDADIVIYGDKAGDEAGWTVGPAGDANGDGRQDLLIGARLADSNGRDRSGSAYVVFGPADPAKLDLADLGNGGFRIDGATAGDQTGLSLSSAGDMNGDGKADVIVGAPEADRPSADPAVTEPAERSGAAFVVFGKASNEPVDLAALGAGGFKLTGAAAGDAAGTSVSSVGDLNEDGRNELLVGAPGADATGRTDSGAVYVVYGRSDTSEMDLGNLADSGWRIDGADKSRAGLSVAGSADVNGDGKGDVLIGAPSQPAGELSGAAYAVWGQKSDGVDLASLPASAGRVMKGSGNEGAGVSVAGLGDVNRDGRNDIAVGALLADNNERNNSGSVYVVFGSSAGGETELSKLNPDTGFRIDGPGEGELAGADVSPIGDWNRDGIRDVLLTAPFADPLSRSEAGGAYIVFGTDSPADLDLSSIGDRGLRVAGADEDNQLRSAAGVGDVNGDGEPDILFGGIKAKNADGVRSGGAFVILGEKPPPPPTPDPGAMEEVSEDKCEAVTNLEFVVDDSGSMEITDPEKLRRQAIELMITKDRNAGEIFGALEFGDVANQLFPPTELDPAGPKSNQKELLKALAQIGADNGGTDYNSGFAVLADENPAAQARIFLTDGEHNVGDYTNGHRNGPPTYVLGLGIGRKGEAGERLIRIADETKGRYFGNVTDGKMPAMINLIDSLLNCDIDFDAFVNTVVEETEPEVYEADLDEDTYSTDVVVFWEDDDDQFEVDEIALLDEDEDVVARLGRSSLARALKRGRLTGGKRVLKVKASKGAAYRSFRVSGVHRGAKLRVTVRPKKLTGGRGRVHTHVMESRRRR